MTKVNPNPSDEDFLVYPTNRVAGIIKKPIQLKSTLDALSAAGFDQDEVEVYCGQEGIHIVDAEGDEHGTLGQILRSIQTFGADYEYAKRHEEALQAGHYLVTVPADEDEEKQKAADILKENGGSFINYFGSMTVEQLAA